MIELDGAVGEGGGQILRSALTLSMITGQAFCIKNIRAGRKKPGLLRQHLVAVQAATGISGAIVTGAQLGSQTLLFAPKAIKGGDYQFAIGSAGSCTLVLQTVMLALLHADGPSTVRISGGTHNPMAPPAQFLQRAYLPLLRKMGADINIELLRSGFYPAGGGCIVATIAPCPQLQQLTLTERGERTGGYAEGMVAGLPASIALRELECVGLGMGWSGDQLRMRGLPADQGPGNALLITLEYEYASEVFCAFGEKMVRAETVAKDAMHEARRYITSQAAVGEHLADQLMLPMALAGGGSFTADVISQHAITNAEVIGRFLPVSITLEEGEQRSTCTVRATA
ncbi:RNA 3'-terminal phosphate cyclase [Massilia sp. CCM 8734]|uniref:RNA 3'-terminal phosphate cyclase n=1 Tax=Massilia sp. CCM 8734 TaxID=2609283 RepID=UPI00141FDA7B|nr:RNA 3'-terminal phosphate cyclase [Massilia sp. CCM 8734]NIA00329.1 RNA 3'-terminal phosphate cyclase [Massilia sp. CCM 8734]